MFPSWIKSKNNSPRPTYLLAIDTTKRKLDSAKTFLASSSPSAALMERFISSSVVSRDMRPISLRYIRTGSLIFTSLVKSSSSKTTTSSSFLAPPDASSSSVITLIPSSIKVLYNWSKESASISKPFKALANCSKVI